MTFEEWKKEYIKAGLPEDEHHWYDSDMLAAYRAGQAEMRERICVHQDILDDIDYRDELYPLEGDDE